MNLYNNVSIHKIVIAINSLHSMVSIKKSAGIFPWCREQRLRVWPERTVVAGMMLPVETGGELAKHCHAQRGALLQEPGKKL